MARLRERLGAPAEDVAWVGAIAAAALLAAAFAWLAPALADLVPDPDRTFFAAWAYKVQPEPLEDVRAVLTLAAPFVLAGAVVVLGTRERPGRTLDAPLIAAQAVAIALIALAAGRQPHVLFPLPSDYLQPLLLSIPILASGAVIGLLLTGLILRWPGSARRVPRWLGRLAGRRRLVLGLAVLVTIVWLLPAVITDPTVGQSGLFTSRDVGLHAEDYLAAVNGRTPLVDYIGEYANLLPFAVAPVLAAFDSSVTAFTVIMTTLSAVALLAVFGVIAEATRRPWVALALYVPFLALALFPWHEDGAFRQFDGNYYAVLPDRLLGPFLLAWMCAVRVRTRRVPIWAIFLIAGLTLINNSEFGTGALIATALALLLGSDRSIPISRRLAELARGAAIGLIAAVAIVCAVTLIRTGSLPDPALLNYYSRLVLRQSFGLMPMPSLGLHWALYATYASALVMAAVRQTRAEADRLLTAMLGFAGAFGLISGMYYVGRSVEFQLMILFPIWAFCLVLVAWSAGTALRADRQDRTRLRRILVPAAAAMVGLGVMVSAIVYVPLPWEQVSRLGRSGNPTYDLPNTQRFVEANSSPGDRVLIIGTPVDHRVAERADVLNVSPLNGLLALVSSTEAERALDQLQDEGGTEVFEAVTAPNAINPLGPRLAGFAEILRQRGYRQVERDPSTGVRLWRRSATAPAT